VIKAQTVYSTLHTGGTIHRALD